MGSIGGMAAVIQERGQAPGQADLLVYTVQQQRTEIRLQDATIEISTHCQTRDRRKAKLFWSKLGHRRPRLASSKAFLVKRQLYQLVER